MLAAESIVVARGTLLRQDREAWIWVVEHLGNNGFRILEGISLAGVVSHPSQYLMVGATLGTFLVAVALYLRHMPFSSVLFLTDVAGAAILVSLLKLVVSRHGPSLTPWIAAGHTFPSGTAAVSVAFFGFLAYLLYQTSRHVWTGRMLAALCVILSLAFVASALTYHYPTEVLGGICTGLAWLALLQLAFWNPLRKEIFGKRGSP